MSAEAVETNGTETSTQNPEEKAEVAASQGGLVQASKASSLDLYERPRLPQNRPIEPSHAEIVGSIYGNRPVFASGLDISTSIVASGSRPIVKSHLAISETYTVMGNRPVASNEIEDINTLIGYID
ncbi:MAG: hypothetical protein SVX43_23145 [Cyanobacteriota bacterium]|nr:hypothetical protein [Cyanobacteriota bacterium]